MFFRIQLILAALSGVLAVNQNNTCPSVATIENIDLKHLSGIWYVSEAATDKISGVCARITFTFKTDNYTELVIEWGNKTRQSQSGGKGTKASGDGTGERLDVVFSDNSTTNYNILKVSYDHYALLYSCQNTTDGSDYELWKLSRKPKLAEKHAAVMDKIIQENNIKFGNTFLPTGEACYNNGIAITNNVSLAILGTSLVAILKQLLL